QPRPTGRPLPRRRSGRRRAWRAWAGLSLVRFEVSGCGLVETGSSDLVDEAGIWFVEGRDLDLERDLPRPDDGWIGGVGQDELPDCYSVKIGHDRSDVLRRQDQISRH